MAKKYSKKKRTYKTRRLTRRFRGAGSPLARKPNTSTSTSTNPKKMTTPTPRRQSMMEETLRSNNKDNIRSIERDIASIRNINAIKKREEMKMELLRNKDAETKFKPTKFKPLNAIYEKENEENEENDEDENYDDLYER